MRCFRCDNKRWVCENHPDRPWEGVNACTCGGGGMPCPVCNVPGEGAVPRMSKGFKRKVDKDGSRH
jgi:hypothetical protein